MKKLFTLLAFLTCFLGAKAIVVVDAEVDYSQMADGSEIKFYGWGAADEAKQRLSIQNGCLHFHSEEATDPTWACQFHPIGGVSPEEGVTYTLHFKVKGSVAENISALGFGLTPYGQFPITTDWVEGTFDYTAQKDANGNMSGDLLFQCGGYVGDFDIAYLKITHEEREQRPVEWENILTNGDASAAWENPEMAADNEDNGTICAWSKEWGYLMNSTNADAGGAAIPDPHPALIEDGVFVCHAKAVEPALLWATAGEQWGQQHAAGDEMPDNTWQNQFWINLPRKMKDGEQVKISFKYKASKAVTVGTQDHTGKPGDYLGGGQIGNLSFSTEWQTFEKTISAAAGMQSVAFNVTGDGTNWKEDIDFYFDDITASLMKLDNGFFVAGTDTEDGTPEYDFDNAIELIYDEAEEKYAATIGEEGKEDTWVNEVMISTVRGNDKAFKSATLKATETVKTEEWVNYQEGSNAKIKLPARGVWTVVLSTEYGMLNFIKVEGEEDKEPVDIVTNPEVLVVNGLERDYTSSEQEGGTGAAWDNQFWIFANRTLEAGEETVVEFDYVASQEAKVTTQSHGLKNSGTATEYIHWAAIGDVNFAMNELHFKYDFTIPAEAAVKKNQDGTEALDDEGNPIKMQGIAFNMAEIKEACDYTIKNVQWYIKTSDNEEGKTTENLINATGTENFWIKVGAGTAPYKYGTDPSGINNVVKNSIAPAATFNLAGQRVSKEYKGVVVKNGKKVVVK